MTETFTKSKEIEIIKDIIRANLPYEETDYGKMIRSKIGTLLLKTNNIDTKEYLNFLSAIELIHTASLLHDDVIDNDDTRRGKPNLKSAYDSKTSVLFGDIILSNALKLLADYNSTELINLFNTAINNMCKGELLQHSMLENIPTTEQYIEKSRLKTASLFEFIIDGINILSKSKLPPEFGTNFGIAFQIKNDLENILNNNSDIDNGIYTAPVIFSGNTNISQDGIEKTQCLIDNYRSKCIDNLSKHESNIYLEELIGVVECLTK